MFPTTLIQITLQWLFFLFWLTLPVTATALPSDRDKPIEIVSDTLEADNNTGIAIYTGEVVVTQGTTLLTGDKVTVYTTERVIKRIVVEGGSDLAYYEEEQENNEGQLQAWGETMDYKSDAETIELFRQAKISRQDETLSGEYIHYDLKNDRVLASQGSESSSDSPKRVRMRIKPKKKTSPEG